MLLVERLKRGKVKKDEWIGQPHSGLARGIEAGHPAKHGALQHRGRAGVVTVVETLGLAHGIEAWDRIALVADHLALALRRMAGGPLRSLELHLSHTVEVGRRLPEAPLPARAALHLP